MFTLEGEIAIQSTVYERYNLLLPKTKYPKLLVVSLWFAVEGIGCGPTAVVADTISSLESELEKPDHQSLLFGTRSPFSRSTGCVGDEATLRQRLQNGGSSAVVVLCRDTTIPFTSAIDISEKVLEVCCEDEDRRGGFFPRL
jgi:hypothetical protein